MADPTGLVTTCSASLLVVGGLPHAPTKARNAAPPKLILDKERYEARERAVVTVQSLLTAPCRAVGCCTSSALPFPRAGATTCASPSKRSGFRGPRSH